MAHPRLNKRSFCWFIKGIIAIHLSLLGVGCTSHSAPVVDGWQQRAAKEGDYRVQRDDSLYSIAWAYGMDYKELARINNLAEPYHLRPQQRLRMSRPVANTTVRSRKSFAGKNMDKKPALQLAVSTPRNKPRLATTQMKPSVTSAVSSSKLDKNTRQRRWSWPTQGRVTRSFSTSSRGNRGIDIAGKPGQKVIAAASGKVVYTGTSMPGYGNLIILKHTEEELSAYAWNKKILVKEGDRITAGQLIAEMGQNDAHQAILHFEIRKNGKPVNPMSYL